MRRRSVRFVKTRRLSVTWNGGRGVLPPPPVVKQRAIRLQFLSLKTRAARFLSWRPGARQHITANIIRL
nr:MAG TPA: hypothetical protein [Caudoviricetes sp.]